MSEYDINISRMFRTTKTGEKKSEIWAEIIDKDSCETLKKKIWWEDDEGTHHDETPSLPIDIRKAVDNAWIEKKRRW